VPTNENVRDRGFPVGRARSVRCPYVETEHRVVPDLLESADQTYQTGALIHVEISFIRRIPDNGVTYIRIDVLVRIRGLDDIL